MKAAKLISILLVFLLVTSCGSKDNKVIRPFKGKTDEAIPANIALDKGFSEYISGYTSGIIPANSAIEIRFTPEFAAKADKSTSGLFVFEPAIKGKTEWKDETTLVFTPSRLLDEGKIYTGGLNLNKLSEVKERLKIFPLRIQTLKKDFRVTVGALECSSAEGTSYLLNGEIVTADFIEPAESENYLVAKLGRKKMELTWDHSTNLIHKFTVIGIDRTNKVQELNLTWDGTSAGVKQKGSSSVSIPPSGEFSIIDIITVPGESQRIDVAFSDPLDASQETDGLIHFSPSTGTTININSNIISIFPVNRLQGSVDLNVESSIRNNKGVNLSSSFLKQLDFTSVPPGIMLEGNGVILPSSQNLIFPFKAANLKAVDLKIVRIFENNLPWFLQENDLNNGNSVKRFGRPVYSGRVDLVTGSGTNTGTWNLYTIDLADYIDVEPGVLYKVSLGMRKFYSFYPCSETGEESKYEEMLQQSEERSREFWDDPENYYDDNFDDVYYSFGFDWEDRNNPCKDAYYSPDRRVSRNVLASNFGLIAKKGDDNILHVMVNDLLTAMPVNEVTVEVYDLQMQLIISGTTNQDGSVALFCERKPFLVIAKKDKDRNYLKTNDGSSLSLSSFDVAGNKPENGIKAFVYGERDVWRPGDSIFLSIFIKDMKSDLPPGHPVQFELINPLEQRVDNQVQKPERSNLLVFTTKTAPDAVTGNYKALFRIGGATFTKRIRIETVKPNRLKINLNFPGEILGGSNPVSRGTLNVKWLNGAVAKNLKSSVEYMFKHTKTEFEKYGQYVFDDPITQFYSETVNIFDNAIDENGNAIVIFDPGKEINAPGMLNAVFTAKASEPGGDESITQTTYKYAPYPVFAGINLPGLKGKSRMLFTDTDNEVKIVTVDEKGRPVRSEVEITVYKISYRWWWESDQEDLAYYISNNNYKPVIRKTITTSGGESSFSFNINKNEWGRYLIRATTPAGHSTGKILLIDWPWEYGIKGNTDGATQLAINTDKEKYNPGDEIKLSFPAPENARAIITLENTTGVLEEIRVNTEKGNTVVSFRAKPEMAPNIYAYVTVIQPHAQTVNDMPVRLYGVVPVMVVDEGLLDITGFRTPDPWNYFYAREALGVQTWDLYDFVLGAFGGTLERIFAIGGDEAVIDKSANKAQRFIPVVKFLGPFNLASGKTNTHTLTFPQYTGSVRTMVIAGSDRSFGIAEKSVLVKDPLMVLVTAPRVISPGEKVALPMTLFIQKEGIKDITVRAEANELVSFEEKTKSLSVSAIGEKDTEFTFTVGEKTGVAKISVTASGGGETATYNMEIEVRSPNPPEIRAEVKVIRQGEKWETTFKPFGIEGSNSALLEVSSLPSINLEKRMEYLLDYPHGCSEQITSAAFPQLWLKDLTGSDAAIVQSASANITEAINKIISRQMPNGGIALWPGAIQPDNWVTSYAGHFMTEAERKGYSIPSGFRQKWISYQKKTAQEWRFDTRFKQSANDQAYRLFTLALAGQPEKGAMNRLRESSGIPQLSRWLLAAAFATTGRPEVAGDLLDVRNTGTEQEYYNYYYGSEMRDKAIILYTLTLLKNEEQALLLLKEICNNFNNNEWYSTQSIAWGLFSYMKWTELIPGDKNSPTKIKINLNGEKSEQTIQSKQVWSKDIKMTNGDNSLVVENSSEKPLYVTLTRKGIPFTSDIVREDKGLIMKIDYADMDLKAIDQKNLQQGTDFMMVVKVTNNTFSMVENIALTEMIPLGWEIQNTRLFEVDYGIKESTYDYRDFRDDRVNTYFNLTQGQTKTFVLILNAAYKGEFYQPSVWCEAMYTANCYSRYPGNPVKVTGQKIEKEA
ncbi:MAG: MG2 domain-containing protein [Bacteroidia bacterium]|nr:MG2 domain-containing protein [Bacteroidia bacterium]